MERDLTAVLVQAGPLDAARAEAIVAESGRHAVLVRFAPLLTLGLVQVEVHDARRGMPTEDPDLVARLSRGGRATFVHVNHSAKQAIVHGFVDGKPSEGFAGAPGEAFDARLRAEIGADLAAIHAADDGSRLGIGVTASHTRALVHGSAIAVPAGTPTGLDSFFFHDRGAALDEGEERLAWFAFDRAAAFERPGTLLAQLIASLPAGRFGPLEGARDEAVAELAALGERTPAQARLTVPRALELCALAAARAWAGGDQLGYWDGRVLPLFAICAAEPPPAPVFDQAEATELDDETESILEAMVETLPFAAPPDGEGPLLTSLSPSELRPLAPWATGGEHAGSIFALAPERLLTLVRKLDGQRLGNAVQTFARVWYRALRPGQPEGDAYATFRQAKEEESQSDLDRFVADWAELRACLEIAQANALDMALMFYA